MDDTLDIAWAKRLKIRKEHIEAFAARYCSMTGIPPDEAMLVEEIVGNKVRWYFTRKPSSFDSKEYEKQQNME